MKQTANFYDFERAFETMNRDEYETLDDIRDETTVIDVDIETDEDGNENGSFIIQVF